MHKIVLSALAIPLLLSGCSTDLFDTPQQIKDPKIIYLTCSGQENQTEVYRDMSKIRLGSDTSEVPFYLASQKDSTWIYSASKPGPDIEVIKLYFDRANHTYTFSRFNEPSITCDTTHFSDEPPIITQDILSDEAKKDEENQKRIDRERKIEDKEERPRLEKARKQCNMYIQDLSSKINFESQRLLSSSPIGPSGRVMCVVLARDAVHQIPHTIIINGRGPYYDYDVR